MNTLPGYKHGIIASLANPCNVRCKVVQDLQGEPIYFREQPVFGPILRGYAMATTMLPVQTIDGIAYAGSIITMIANMLLCRYNDILSVFFHEY